MKTVKEWIEKDRVPGQIFRCFDHSEISDVQLDAMKEGLQIAIDYMVGHYWGHEIIRAAVYHLCATNGLPMPKVPFAPERLHPGATRPEVPPAQDRPATAKTWKNYEPERVWVMDPLGPGPSSPPSPQSEDCLQPAQSAAPAASAPPTPAPPTEGQPSVEERLKFHSEYLVKLKEQADGLGRNVEALWNGPCALSPASTAWHHWVWGYVEPLLKRVELLEKEIDLRPLPAPPW